MPIGRAVDDPEANDRLKETREKAARGEGLSLADAMRTGRAAADEDSEGERPINRSRPG